MGENPRDALVREVEEELALGLLPAALRSVGSARNAGPPAIVLELYTATRWSGEPAGLEGQAWEWFSLREAAKLPLAPLDRELLAQLAG